MVYHVAIRQNHSFVDANIFYSYVANTFAVSLQNAIYNVNNVQIIQGQGVGCLMRVNLNGGAHKLVRIDTVNDNLKLFTYSVVGGTNFNANVTEKISYEMRFAADPVGGSVVNLSVLHHPQAQAVDYHLSYDEVNHQGFETLDGLQNSLEEN